VSEVESLDFGNQHTEAKGNSCPQPDASGKVVDGIPGTARVPQQRGARRYAAERGKQRPPFYPHPGEPLAGAWPREGHGGALRG
jgi:hypothetical protein